MKLKLATAAALGVLLLSVGAVTGTVLIAGVPVAASGTSCSNPAPAEVCTLDYGAPAAPQSIVPSDLDVQIHRRDPSDAMETMAAGHGTDCSAPPATHLISTLAEGVYACKNHLMTAIGDSGYGEIALTPPALADWSTGTTAITFNVSTLQDNNSDWLELWLTPFADNQTLPFDINTIDMQGPPKNAIRIALNQGSITGGLSGDTTFFSNYTEGVTLPKVECTYSGDQTCINPTGQQSVVPPSAVTRIQYEVDISATHIKVGLPGIVTWTDTNVTVPFTQAVVQLTHHSYDPAKHSPGTGIDTWHWSNLAISNAVPFTILNGDSRSIHAGTSAAINFPAPAPTGSFLRFSALGNIQTSWDSGATWHNAVRQGRELAIEHFTSYMTPVPAGISSVLIRGTNNAYGQDWWVRDPAIWSLSTGGLPSPSPSATPSVVPSPTPSPSPTPQVTPSPSPSPSPSPIPTLSPSPSPVTITGAPCTVTMPDGSIQTGTCSGTFTPA